MSLKLFHMIFVLVAIVLADMFGAWAFWEHSQRPSGGLILAGALSFALGLGLVVYAIALARKWEREHLA